MFKTRSAHTIRKSNFTPPVRSIIDHRSATSLPQVFTEDTIDIGNGRRAHFRRDRRYAQVQVAFTAPKGIDPNPGRELTDQFKELGWTWQSRLPGKPWVHQLDRSTPDDPTARGDSRDVLHEQFLLIIQEYRIKHGMTPFLDGFSEGITEPGIQNPEQNGCDGGNFLSRTGRTIERQEVRSVKRETRAGGTAEEMLDAFASVGVERFDLTLTDRAGEKVAFRSNQSLDQLRTAMPGILAHANRSQQNVIIRPRGPVIQLDDLDEAAIERLRPVSFLVLRTSPRNHQAWVAVVDADEDFARRLRRGAGADLAASGATRVSGSINFKEKYAPTFPHVETVETNPSRVVTRADLEALGIVAPAVTVDSTEVCRKQRSALRGWPNYQRCVAGAPEAREGGRPDISRADFTFCLLAIDWGWSVEETAARLMEVSSKAQEQWDCLRRAHGSEPQRGAIAGRRSGPSGQR